MKRCAVFALFALACLGAGTASAASGAHRKTAVRVIPVLVHVDRSGNVTDFSPAYKMRPSFKRLLGKTLKAMITHPAVHKGHPISSQFVLNLALVAVPGKDGTYAAKFDYVSSKPLPAGSWSWVQMDGGRLALQEANGTIQPTEAIGPRDFATRPEPGNALANGGP